MKKITIIVISAIVILLVVWLIWSHNNKVTPPAELSPEKTSEIIDSLSAPETSAKNIPTKEQKKALDLLSTPSQGTASESPDDDILRSLQAQ